MFDSILENQSEEKKKLRPSHPNRPNPEKLWVAKHVGQAPEEVPTEQVEKALSFTFSESLWAPECFLEATQEKRDSYKSHLNEHCQHDAFQLVNMGPLGYSLFARNNIKKGSFLFFYTGEYTSETQFQGKDGSYAMYIKDSFFGYENSPIDYDLLSPLFADLRKGGIIDATDIGNLSRFAQHLPQKNDLHAEPTDFGFGSQFVMLNEDLLESVATCATSDSVLLDGLSVVYTKAATDYEPGDIVGISYGFSYWKGKQIQPELFTRKGETIPYDQYYPCNIYLKIPTGNMDWREVNIQKVFKALVLKQGIENIFYDTRRKRAIEKISYDTLREKTIEHLGEERYKAHMSCFLQKNPTVVLDYRTSRFFTKHQKDGSGSWKHNIGNRPSQYEGENQAPEKLLSRLSHFGFNSSNRNNITEVDVESSDYKVPNSAKF